MTKDRYSKTSLGIHLKQLRQEAGLKLVDVAGECGIQASYLSMIESGDRVPALDLLYRLAKALGVPPISILTLADSLPKGIVSDLLEKERLKLELATFRIRKLTSVYMKDNNGMSAETILDYLENHDRDHLQVLYNNAVEKFPELKDLPEKEAILKAQMEEISPGEALLRNETPTPSMMYLETPEMLLELKKTLRWSWEGLGAEFGVSGRTVFRGAHRKCKISKKIKKKIDYLYWAVLRRLKEDVKPLYFGYLNESGAPLDMFLSELEEAGLGSEIKRRFIELEPDLKPLKDKILAEFFLERARANTNPSVSKIMELNSGKPAKILGKTNRYKSTMDGGVSSVSMKTRNGVYKNNARLVKAPRKQMSVNNSRRESKQSGGNKAPPSGDDDGGEGNDADSWLLKSVIRNRNIYLEVELLFENLKLKARETGKEVDLLHREVKMSIYERKNSRYFYVNISFNGDRFRTTSRCENRREAEKIKTLLLAKLINSLPIPGTEEKKVPLFKDASEKFVGYQRGKNLASWKRDELSHRQVCLYLGNRPVNQIKSPDIQAMMVKEGERIGKGGKKIAPRTININRGYVHRLFEYAVNVEEWVDKNPVSKVPPLPENNFRDKVVSPEEELQLKVASDKEWFRDMISFALATSLRIGEVASLKKTAFSLTTSVPHFKIAREKNKIITEFPIVQQELLDLINKYVSTGNSDSFFQDEDGKAITVPKIVYQLKKALRKSGLKRIIFHDFRRSFYTRMRWAGCNPTVLEYLMGHKQSELVTRYLAFDLNSIAKELQKVYAGMKKTVTHLSQSPKTGKEMSRPETLEMGENIGQETPGG